jgi:hypothetical protein
MAGLWSCRIERQVTPNPLEIYAMAGLGLAVSTFK